MPHADNLPFNSRRPSTLASGGMVATSQQLAALAGVDILRAGGNAADAAIATAAALAVTEPTSTGLGGDCFALYYEAATKTVHAVNGSGRAPAASSIEALAERGVEGTFLNAGPVARPHTVTVPGTAAGWHDTLQRHGRMALSDVLQPAIRLADDGFPMTPIISAYWDEQMPLLEAGPNGDELMIDGHAPRPGEIWRNANLAAVLRTIAEGGPEAFYGGDAGSAIVDVLGGLGGLMTADDLTSHTTTFDPPISTTYRGMKIYECSPNGQGLTVLIALNILEGFNLREIGHNSALYLHLLTESMRRAYADRANYLGDLDFNEGMPIADLISKKHAAKQRNTIVLHKASESDPARFAQPYESEETTHFSVVDKSGNMVSLTYTLEHGYGSKIVVDGAGFLLNNEMGDFNAQPGVTTESGTIGTRPNQIRPEQRMLSSMTPTIVAKNGIPLFATGTPGGRTIINTTMQTILNIIDFDMNIARAISAPRIHHQWLPNRTRMESGFFSADTIALYEQRGHIIDNSDSIG